jgi:hypothetical protein
VALDDFGTGYSSMAYLKKFDIDYLKIDKSFVHDIEANAGSRAIAESIIVMAHRLGLKVIAEGVETAGQEKILQAAGCDYEQGYLFSKAVPPDTFERMLAIESVTEARMHTSLPRSHPEAIHSGGAMTQFGTTVESPGYVSPKIRECSGRTPFKSSIWSLRMRRFCKTRPSWWVGT